MPERHLTREDGLALSEFRAGWRAHPNFYSEADCHTTIPYGQDGKFFAALFTVDRHEEMIDEGYREALSHRRDSYATNALQLDQAEFRLLSGRPNHIDWNWLIYSLEFVQAPSAASVLRKAIVRFRELNPKVVLPSPSEIGALALANPEAPLEPSRTLSTYHA